MGAKPHYLRVILSLGAMKMLKTQPDSRQAVALLDDKWTSGSLAGIRSDGSERSA